MKYKETMPVKKIISGGQTGIDRIALEVANLLGIPTGGTAPRNYMTEIGPDYGLIHFGLAASQSAKYPDRTKQNILDSDGTLLLGNPYSGGSTLTRTLCDSLGKPIIVNPNINDFSNWINGNGIKILNVAGNRGSRLSAGESSRYTKFLKEALSALSPNADGSMNE